jgi:16S rRNA (cytosine967-C5)-methyltransferase
MKITGNNMLMQTDRAEIIWPDMYKIWRDFCQAPELPFCDRWLKQIFKTQFPVVRVSLPEQLALTQGFNLAITYLELATYLQQAYNKEVEDFTTEDFFAFDAKFVPQQAKDLPHTDFWYWVALRTNLPCEELSVREKNKRHAFYSRFRKYAENTNNTAAQLLWHGLRPEFLEALNARAEASGWTQNEKLTFIQNQSLPLPLWVRNNSTMSERDVADSLIADGVNAEVDANGFVYADGGRGINQARLYKTGEIEIQDLSSQHIALAVAVEPGQKVWDACAGAGGKTLAIASRMGNKGVIVATDLYDYKLLELKRRAKRAEIFNLRMFTWDGRAPLRLPKEVARQKGFDWILIDAPCSSSGTWRRNPDARWRFNAQDTADLVTIQQQIMLQSLPGLRKDGHLVYATCSWQVAENEAQVQWLLSQAPELELVSQQVFGSPHEQSDTMYMAIMKKVSA